MFLCVLGYFWYFWVLFGIVLYRYCTDIVSTLYQYISHSLGRRNSFVCHFETHATVALLGLFIFNPLKLSPLSLPLPFLNFYLTFTFSNISFSSSFIAFSVLPLIFSSSFSSSHSVFLVADTRLYTLPCRSVRPSVRHIFEFWAVFALLLLPNRPRLDCRVSGLVVLILTPVRVKKV